MKLLRSYIPSLWLSLLLAGGPIVLPAQLPCDTAQMVTFSYADQGSYQYGFTAQAPLDGSNFTIAEWGFLGETFMDNSYAASPTTTFPGADNYLVCLLAYVDDGFGYWCESAYCELVPIPVDPACADLVADFTIALAGDAIDFINLSSNPSGFPIMSYSWDFGDGETSDEAQPMHHYDGYGPFEACLTVSTANCTATSCNWIYWGPDDVPCTTLLQPDILVVGYQRTIAAFDRSITSGMNSETTWYFGDGHTKQGNPVIHTYDWEDVYDVCAEVTLWGPLTPGTCVATACTTVVLSGITGVQETGSPAPRAYPVPFDGQLTVSPVEAGTPWQLLDLSGRVLLAGEANGPLVIPGSALAPGPYLLRLIAPKGTHTLRVIKSGGG